MIDAPPNIFSFDTQRKTERKKRKIVRKKRRVSVRANDLGNKKNNSHGGSLVWTKIFTHQP